MRRNLMIFVSPRDPKNKSRQRASPPPFDDVLMVGELIAGALLDAPAVRRLDRVTFLGILSPRFARWPAADDCLSAFVDVDVFGAWRRGLVRVSEW